MKKLLLVLLAISALLAGLQLGLWLSKPDQAAQSPAASTDIPRPQ